MTLAKLGLKDSEPDEVYLRHAFKANMGFPPDLEHPRRFNEKLQWLKLHDRRPEYAAMVDKYEAKAYVQARIGERYVVPTYGLWDFPDEIDFGTLPSQFVLKCTHDCGGSVICRDRGRFDEGAAHRTLAKALKRRYYMQWREWSYKFVKPRIIAEKYLEDDTSRQGLGLTDYKFYCFNGEPLYLYVSTGLEDHTTARISFLTMDWRFAPFRRADFASFDVLPPQPSHFGEMVAIARRLSEGLAFLRVDLYQVDDRVYFSELTFYPCGGMMPFEPDEWDFTFGSLLKLPGVDG